MKIWKLVRSIRMNEPLSTDGARLYGGRWNPVGAPVLYCSCTLSLAALEVLVHIRAGLRTARYHAIQLECPGDEPEVWSVEDLPRGWKSIPCNPACQVKGGKWLASSRCLALAVPSVVVPQELNVLLNPKHPDFKRVSVIDQHPFPFDPRLTAASK